MKTLPIKGQRSDEDFRAFSWPSSFNYTPGVSFFNVFFNHRFLSFNKPTFHLITMVSSIIRAGLLIHFALTATALVIPRAAPGTQFITGPCTSDADCASTCCSKANLCAARLVALETTGCGGKDGTSTAAAAPPAAAAAAAAPPPNVGGPPFDPAGVPNVGNGAGKQFIGGQCLSAADCNSGCCAGPSGICSGVGAQTQAGKTGCGFVASTLVAGAPAAAAPPASAPPAAAPAPAAPAASPTGTQFITGVCAADADCASGCCAKKGTCAARAVALETTGCGGPGASAAPPVAAPPAAAPAPAAPAASPTGTQFITGVCATDADCASGCCAKKGTCAARAVALETTGCGGP
ncbi:hypothetical protein B0H19DRAFT_1020155 [Mycena capillaripes]|nr:hypothetical protein B0H19DRAFT_1020155 [Mycena capillaripes]